METDLADILEWWHVFLSVGLVLLTIALRTVKVFGDAFARWADKLDSLSASVNSRLSRMEEGFLARFSQMETKFQQNEDRVHNLTLRVERRVTRLEERVRLVHRMDLKDEVNDLYRRTADEETD